MKIQTIVILTIILTIVDQVVKIIIYNCFLDLRFDIIPSLFEFYPRFNTKHSYLNNVLNLNLGLAAHLFVFATVQIIFLFFYDLLKKTSKNTKLLDIAFVFQLAGMLCALSGNLVWNEGTLDFIYLKPLFIFDLKDLYLNICAGLALIFYFGRKSGLKSITGKDIVNHLKLWLSKLKRQNN